MNKYKIFGIISVIIIVAGGGSLLAYYGYFSGSNSLNNSPSNNAGKSLQAQNTTKSLWKSYTLVVMGWTTCNGPDPGVNAFGDVSSLIVLTLENGTGGIVYKHVDVGNLTPKELKNMGIIITPAFGWAYAGNTYVGNISYIPPGNPPITNASFYNKVYQKVEVYFPEYLKVSVGKPFGIILNHFNYKTEKKCPPPLKNLGFKFSFKVLSKQECEVWVSIYANGTYIGKVPVVLKIVPPSFLKNRNNGAEEIYKLNYSVALLKSYSWPAYNPLINDSEVKESLLVMVLYNGTINASKISYSIHGMGIGATPGYGWSYYKSPPASNATFLSEKYQKVIVCYPEKLSVTPKKAFGVIIRYLHLPTGKKTPQPLEKLTFKCSLEKLSPKEYKLWISIYANGTYIGKVPIMLTLRP